MPALNSWLDTPLGQHVLAREQAYFDQAVADVFGYHAVQFGLPDQPLLRENRMPWRCRAGESGAVDVTCDPAALPFASQSLDLLLLPHVLDFTSHPHQVLREAERVLVPEGRLMVTGFNPISLWGLARRCKPRDVMPWRANFIAPGRLKDWMQLLSLEPADCQHLCYAPPFEREAWRAQGLPTVPTTIGLERQTNPFLRVNQPAVRAALAAELGEAPADALAAFTALREWKNRF